ncbi:hypothetical protein Cgig2_013869 [Carnegiea gigantea]|uniref:Aminotransferase-like plant mobile domain-containing protein n=1 Tax=Carnegiea gigantea TaxID=171969 RepID=A0A9Q1KJ90_9CARY|nr:hypothetical protein Cgig2_013869 [Carnegiea gigantea]
MDRHLVWAFIKSWILEMKAFKIGQREVPFLVYDVALLTGLPTTGKHVPFEWGQGACEVTEVVKAAMDDYLTRERTSMKLPSGRNRGNEREIPVKKNLQIHGFAMTLQVWFYEHMNLYPHADNKYTASMMPRCSFRLLRTTRWGRGEPPRDQEVLRIEKEAHAAMRKELEYLRALLMVRGQEDSVPACRQKEALNGEAHETRIATSDQYDNDTLPSKLHNAGLASVKDVEKCEQLLERKQTSTLHTVPDFSVDDDMLCDRGDDIDKKADVIGGYVLSMLD